MNEEQARNKEVDELIENRFKESQDQQQWRYKDEVKEVPQAKKYKYQNVDESYKVGYEEDMKKLIFDPKTNIEDRNMFVSGDWDLIAFEQVQMESIEHATSGAYARKKQDQLSRKSDQFFGPIELEGRVLTKFNQVNYAPVHFNLRSRTIFFYQGDLETPVESYQVPLNETTISYNQESDEFFGVRSAERYLKIKKDPDSKELIQLIQSKLLFLSFRSAYALRDEVPDFQISDFLKGKTDSIKSIDFVHETHLKEITNSKYYKDAVGSFLQLLGKEINGFSKKKKRDVNYAEITYPKWLKPEIKHPPQIQMTFLTNIVPSKTPLFNLKIKVQASELQAFSHTLKYIFPFYKKYFKRSLMIYESGLNDEEAKYLMNQINYPMHMISLPKNCLSIVGLEGVIAASGNLSHQIVDLSYNSKLMSISGENIFKICNSNPSIKKLILKGCIVLLGNEDEFFQNFTRNMCLSELELNYMDSYNEAIIKHLSNYNAQLY